MTPGGALTLDLGSTTGWAYGDLGGVPEVGIWTLAPKGTERDRYVALANTLGDFCTEWEPSVIEIESPIKFSAMHGEADARSTYGLRAIALVACIDCGARTGEVSVDLVRGEVLGHSRFAKGTVKGIVLNYLRSAGFDVKHFDAADALLLWLWLRWRLRRIPPPLCVLPTGVAPVIKRSRASLVKESDLNGRRPRHAT